ncbi:GMC oxidoreductase [Pantoea cypripedii]|nr:choline dehydrogenase-like flavoprotein [Pantoea cypripedii]
MEAAPSTSVVDFFLRVYGTGGLRNADTSMFQNISSGNTNAPVIAFSYLW